MGRMNRSTHHRGLLAGLLALVVFASGAVAIAANGGTGAGNAARPLATATPSTTVDGDANRGGRFDIGDDGDGGRRGGDGGAGRGGGRAR
jgi:hypothetical protein